jgi:hypothetical protein
VPTVQSRPMRSKAKSSATVVTTAARWRERRSAGKTASQALKWVRS